MVNSDVSLAGKTALVTGAAKRLGRAMALALAERGARVVVHHNRSEVEAASLCDEIRQRGGEAWPLQADLADASSGAKLFQDAVKQGGAIDILVNNASLYERDTLWDATEESILLNLRVHALTPLTLAREMAGQGRSGTYRQSARYAGDGV